MENKNMLDDNSLQEVSGGKLTVQEEEEFLDTIEDPDERYAWDVAIHYLYNYKNCDFRSYQNILNGLVPIANQASGVKLDQKQFRDICERAYLKFYCKIHS